MGKVDNKTLWPPVTYPTPPSKENITVKEEKYGGGRGPGGGAWSSTIILPHP